MIQGPPVNEYYRLPGSPILDKNPYTGINFYEQECLTPPRGDGYNIESIAKAKTRSRTGLKSLCRRLRCRSATLAGWTEPLRTWVAARPEIIHRIRKGLPPLALWVIPDLSAVEINIVIEATFAFLLSCSNRYTGHFCRFLGLYIR